MDSRSFLGVAPEIELKFTNVDFYVGQTFPLHQHFFCSENVGTV
jgi:hypothetical protein